MRTRPSTHGMAWALVLGLIASASGSVQGQGRTDERKRAERQNADDSPEAEASREEEAAAEGDEEPPQTAEGSSADPGDGQESPPVDDLFSGPDLGPLREELTALMDDLVQARSRTAMLGRQLFKTRVRVKVDNESGSSQSLVRIALELDGSPIYREDGSALGDAARQVFDGFAAPGPHVLTVSIEQRARANADYGYTLNDSYRLEVVRGKLTEVLVVLDDDSDIAEDFPDDGEGEYEVTTRLRVATRDLKEE